MTRYLSDEWISLADEALGALTPLETKLEVGVRVTDGPDGERRYRLVLGPDRVGMIEGPDESDVRLTMTWPIAVAIATGNTSAQREFLDGRLQLGGDPGLLLGHQKALADIDDRLADLRQRTNFD